MILLLMLISFVDLGAFLHLMERNNVKDFFVFIYQVIVVLRCMK